VKVPSKLGLAELSMRVPAPILLVVTLEAATRGAVMFRTDPAFTVILSWGADPGGSNSSDCVTLIVAKPAPTETPFVTISTPEPCPLNVYPAPEMLMEFKAGLVARL